MVSRWQVAMGLGVLLVGVVIGLQLPGLFAGSSSGFLALLAQGDTQLVDPTTAGPQQQGPDTQPGPESQSGPAPAVTGVPLVPGAEATKPADPMATAQPPSAPQVVPAQPQTSPAQATPGVPGAEPTKPATGTAPLQPGQAPVQPGQAPLQPGQVPTQPVVPLQPNPFGPLGPGVAPLGPGLAPPQPAPQPAPPLQVPSQPGTAPGQPPAVRPDGLPEKPSGRPGVPQLPGAPQAPGGAPGVPLPPMPGLPPIAQVPPGVFGMPPGGPGGSMPPLMSPGPGLGMGPLPGMPSPDWGGVPPADVAYGADPLQHLDVYVPRGATPAPILLFVHGGGWAMGDKAELGWLGAKLAEQGVLVAVANYRLSPAVKHPAHAQDVAHAVAWLYRNGANYGGDPQRLYLGGHSAGAHLAALVSLDSTYLAAESLSPSIVRGVVGISGAGYDLDARYAASPLAQLFYGAFGQDPTRWSAAAPEKYVSKSAPQFLLIHGLDDTQAPAAGVQSFAKALKGEGASVRLELLPGLEHGTALLASLPMLRSFVQ